MAEPMTSTDLLKVIGGDLTGFLVSSSNAQTRTALNASEAETLMKNTAMEYERMGAAAAVKTRVEGQAAMESQNRNIRAYQAFGGEAELLKSIELIAQGRERIRAEEDQYRYQEKTSIAKDGILGLIGSQFAKGYIKAQIKKEQEFMQLEKNNIDMLNGVIQTTAQTNKLTTKAITDSSIQAAADLQESEAAIKAANVRIQGLATNTAATKAVAEGSKERLDAWYNYNSVINTERQFGAMNEQRVAQREEREYSRNERFYANEERRIAREAKEENKQMDDITLSYINTSLASVGMSPITGLEAKSRVQLFKAGRDEELQYHYQNGRTISETGQSTVGRSVGESYRILTSIKTNLPDLRKETGQYILAAAAQFDATKEAKFADPKTYEATKAAFAQKFVNEQTAIMYSAINAGDTGNVFNVGDLSSYIGTADNPGIAFLQRLPIVQKLLTPLIEAGQKLDDPKAILNLATAAIAEGKLTSNEAAAGIVEVYKRANLVNQEARGLRGFGIKLPNNGAGYNAKMGAFGATLDLTNQQKVTRYIVSKLVNEAMPGNSTGSSLGEIMIRSRSTDPTRGF